MLVSTGILKQIGEDRVAHTKFSPVYAHSVPQGIFFKIMCVLPPQVTNPVLIASSLLQV